MGAENTQKGDSRGVCEGGCLPIFAGDGVLNKKLHFDLRKKMLIVQQIFIDGQILLKNSLFFMKKGVHFVIFFIFAMSRYQCGKFRRKLTNHYIYIYE